MLTKLIIPIVAIAGVAFAIITVRAGSQAIVPASPLAEPASTPFDSHVAGAGLVEASTENIRVGPVVPGVIERVLVKSGEKVQAGDPLFVIDDRGVKADVAVQEAALAAAEAELSRLSAMPRPEDVPMAEARLAAANATLADKDDELAMWSRIDDSNAVSDDEMNRRRFAVQIAQAGASEASAALEKLRRGAWGADVAIAQANVASAEARLAAARVEVERRVVRAPVNGTILHCDARTGEYAAIGAAPILLGSTTILHVRVDVDENDAWRVTPQAQATASLRGNASIKATLSFVRIEPYVIPKRSLTGESTERVDTRVLQVIYAFNPADMPAYVGQQVDVFIEAK